MKMMLRPWKGDNLLVSLTLIVVEPSPSSDPYLLGLYTLGEGA